MVSAPAQQQDRRLIWSFWLAAGIALVGGLLPLVFGGTSSRLSGVILPFAVGAAGFAACALLNTQSRLVVAIIYFLAGLAIVYGLMSMFSLPVRLAALGSCPVAPQPCTTGLPRAMSDAENNGLGSAAACGIAALFVGFFGLVTLYRQLAPPQFVPPVRTIPPMPPAEPSVRPDDHPSAAAKSSVGPDELAPAAEEELELPAPEELPELPAHESTAGTT
ncbi:MAG TPA: hypothetical protein VGX22_01240 [Candidatus Dormibacteraeota bacterium]|nr:hypothetical protein [Candidatus Dormibacteraeota bacterium]